jgi:sodium transport system permease protein
MAVIGKEFRRFFTDRRIVLTTMVLPGLMIFIIYSMLGGAMQGMLSIDGGDQARAYAVSMPASLAEVGADMGLTYIAAGPGDIADIQAAIADGQADLLMVFPSDFDSRVARQLSGEMGVSPPEVEAYYSSASTTSVMQYQAALALLEGYKHSLAPIFEVNPGDAAYDLADPADTAGLVTAMMLPMLILVFLFAGCTSVAPESIAGEKERGTIATILVTPLARWELALGKIVALSCIALASGLSSFLGVMLSLPRLLDGIATDAVALSYSPGDYLMLLGVIVSTVLLFVGAVSLLSALAKTVKEASTYVLPLVMVVMVVGVSSMFFQGGGLSLAVCLVPIVNSMRCMMAIFSFRADPLGVALSMAVNIALTMGCVALLTRMFNDERIVFAA